MEYYVAVSTEYENISLKKKIVCVNGNLQIALTMNKEIISSTWYPADNS